MNSQAFNYFISSLLTSLATLFLGIFVYSRSPKSSLFRIFALYSLSISAWSLPFAFMANAPSEKIAYFLGRLFHFPVTFICIFFLHFVFILIDGPKQRRPRILYFFYAIAVFFTIIIPTKLFVLDVVPKFGLNYFVNPGPFYYPYAIFWVSCVTYGMFRLFGEYKISSGIRRNQLKYLFFGSLIGYLGGPANFLLVFDIKYPGFPYGTYAIPIYVAISTYAIVKFRLLDIKIAITRTGIFIAVYTLVLGIPFVLASGFKQWLSSIIGISWWVVPLGVMAILATTGPFLYIYLNRKAEEKLLKEQKSYQSILRNASLEMTRFKDLRVLLEFMVHITTVAVRIRYAGIYLLSRDSSYYKLEATKNREGNAGLFPRIEMSSILVKWLSDKKEPLVAGEIKRHLQDHPQKDLEEIKNQMELMNIAVIVPSFVENKLLAFMALGDKISGEIYSPDDLHVFTVLASQAALAIENVRFLEDAREMQEQISQAEKMATIGTMADGLSHQINNRFHALSLIAGDILDTINLADTGNYSPEQSGLLSQIKHGLERIQANVVQGGEVVKGMLKYSRKGEEGFSAVSLDKIIDSTLEMVQYKIKLNRIDIVRDYPKDVAQIRGNLTQLQEVFFNLIDNAYDAMMERQDAFKEDGYRPKIRIHTEDTHNGSIRIKVEDNGMGVRPEDAGKMFTPFFTTKVSSRKGTGLGLYVIKKIVVANHHGKINVESRYQQGTTFILDLPLYKGKEE